MRRSPDSSAEFQNLKGRWRRPDGGYILAIKSIADGGAIDAAYFNPNSIHVAKAEALREGDTTRVFIELRDVNYPGSTYTLTYDPASDQLKGIYYQAVERQRFDVVFARLSDFDLPRSYWTKVQYTAFLLLPNIVIEVERKEILQFKARQRFSRGRRKS